MFNFNNKNKNNKVNQENKLRVRLVNLLFNYYAIFSIVILIFIAINFSVKDQKEVIKLMWDSQIYLVHMAIGFYFGDRLGK